MVQLPAGQRRMSCCAGCAATDAAGRTWAHGNCARLRSVPGLGRNEQGACGGVHSAARPVAHGGLHGSRWEPCGAMRSHALRQSAAGVG